MSKDSPVADTDSIAAHSSLIQPYLEQLLTRFGNLQARCVIIALASGLVGAASLVVYLSLIGSITAHHGLYVVIGWVVSTVLIYIALSLIVRNLMPDLRRLVRHNLYEGGMLRGLLDDEYLFAAMMKRFPGLSAHQSVQVGTSNPRSFKNQISLFCNTTYLYTCVYFRCKYLNVTYYYISRISYIIMYTMILINSLNTLCGWFSPPVFALLLAVVAYTCPYGLIITACVRFCLVDALHEAFFGDVPAD